MALISALFITTNCAKEEVSPINEETRSEAVSFKLNVSAQETRTTTEDGATVNWASGDAINVFHAVSVRLNMAPTTSLHLRKEQHSTESSRMALLMRARLMTGM